MGLDVVIGAITRELPFSFENAYLLLLTLAFFKCAPSCRFCHELEEN